MFVITASPEHDAAMYELEDTVENVDLYPVCEICGEHIVPGEKFFEDGGAYYHEDCMEFSEMGVRYA